ncbi:MAG: cysteine--tRNA ligase [Deltaproteobacteria bacterium]
MGIVFFNSLTRRKEALAPLAAGKVMIYSCGVTVYDDCHVGHARSLFIFDGLKRYLEYRGYEVKLVRNITDVDDKIINRAAAEKTTFTVIRSRYIDSYYRDLKALEIDKADFEPCATENIVYMIDHIKRLEAKGAAYAVDGDVYFSVRSFAPYGRLSNQSIDEMRTAVRIEKDEKKRDPLDFALWKKSKEGEPSWPSPWGPGRPGWHIECSTMSMRYLRTETLDIHAGGRDLIFPHHENEIAQAEALTGKPFARCWIHHGLLTIDGRKMSKSLGNFITIGDALRKASPNALKLFFLQAHYASAMDFTDAGLAQAGKALEKLETFLDKAALLPQGAALPEKCEPVEELVRRFGEAVDDDFNTAQGVAVLFELVNFGNRSLDAKDAATAASSARALVAMAGAVGLKLHATDKTRQAVGGQRIRIADPAKMTITQEEAERLLAERQAARGRRDYKRADALRDALTAQGIVIEDTGA